MSNLVIWDHLYALAVFVVYPVIGKLSFPADIRKIRENGENAKITVYRQTMIITAGFALALCILWLVLGRDWVELGIRSSTATQILSGLALSGAFLLLTVLQFRHLLKSDSPDLGSGIDDLAVLVPRTDREQKWFRAVSTNAGITEELIFRGFLIWYLGHFVGLAWSALIAVALFALAHAYQGLKQMPALAVVSAVMVGLYLLSGSLWLPILLHTSFDMLQGHYVARLLDKSKP